MPKFVKDALFCARTRGWGKHMNYHELDRSHRESVEKQTLCATRECVAILPFLKHLRKGKMKTGAVQKGQNFGEFLEKAP